MGKEKEKNIEEQIKDALESIRPFIIMDGGDIEFIKYEDKIVYIKFVGACANCLYSDDTLENGVFETIKEAVPEIDKVVKVDF